MMPLVDCKVQLLGFPLLTLANRIKCRKEINLVSYKQNRLPEKRFHNIFL
ncbi:hypothetical protein HanXRQr2_Chr14g0670321 [Helianthus annuus]|uniref:Uncharacterized protein n=1 Tax=Helianthus annuus TaxID=4232 RepID=A0A9K3H8X9_HELAN|nr:hypothetical protein HanXRQr2_Chr14g0670321 [Helianthus annuus]